MHTVTYYHRLLGGRPVPQKRKGPNFFPWCKRRLPAARARRRWVSLATLLLTLIALGASAATPKRVLILDSFGRDVAPFSIGVSAFRRTLTRELGQPVDIYEASLDLARFAKLGFEEPLVAFLENRVGGAPVDLVVPVGAPAAQFAAQQRKRLFWETPVLYMGVDPRRVPPDALATNATLVTQPVDLSASVEDILRLRPDTTNIVVVLGNSPLEQFWAKECRREWQAFTNRVGFTWLQNLSLAQIRQRVSTLPGRTVVDTSMLILDGDGVQYDGFDALDAVAAAANAPVFGFFRSQLGRGVIGGRLYQDTQVGVEAARVAIRILLGERASEIPPVILDASPPTYDWRELTRWGIRPDQLPAGSVIEHRVPTFWAEYRWHIIGIVAFCSLQTVLVFGLLVNAFARKRASEALRESEERLREAAEAAGFGIYRFDLVSGVAYYSPEFLALYGLPVDATLELDSELVPKAVHPDDKALFLAAIRRSNDPAGSGIFEVEFRVVLDDGQIRWLRARGRTVFEGDGPDRGPVRANGIIQDVSARRRAEQELGAQQLQLAHVSRVASMGQLASSLAHELNQPLGAILRNAEAAELLLQASPLDTDELRAIVADIHNDDRRAGGVIDRMRDLMKRRDLKKAPLEVGLLASDAMVLVRPDADMRHVKLALMTAPSLPLIEGDRVQLQQVVLNLLINALDAVSDRRQTTRRVTVQVRATRGEVEMSVRDNGRGIPADKLSCIFEPFYTSKPDGMGMGLAISKTIVEAHGGRLWAENGAEGGAVFFFTLPIADREGQGREEGKRLEAEPRPPQVRRVHGGDIRHGT